MKQADIARVLNVSQSVVSRLLKKHRETGSVKDRKRSGRPKATTPRQDRLLFRMSRQNRFIQVKPCGPICAITTV